MEFRLLKANEIQIRVNQVRSYNVNVNNEKVVKASFLLYKDARCDMNILDETVGAFNWQKRYTRENANCIVSIWDEEKKQWIEKEDTGVESFSEAEKGLASDSFKRACFNWGIGRELYTAPNIVITLEDKDYYAKTDEKGKEKIIPTINLEIKEIKYDNKNISQLIIVDDKGKERFNFDSNKKVEKPEQKKQETKKQEIKSNDVDKDFSDLHGKLVGLGYDLSFDDRVKQFISEKSGVKFDNNFDSLSIEDKNKVVLEMAKLYNTASKKKGK